MSIHNANNGNARLPAKLTLYDPALLIREQAVRLCRQALAVRLKVFQLEAYVSVDNRLSQLALLDQIIQLAQAYPRQPHSRLFPREQAIRGAEYLFPLTLALL